MSRYKSQVREVINRNTVVSLALAQGFNAFLPVYDGGVDFILYLAHSLSAVFAAFVGVMLATRIGIGNATQADGWELQAIASTVIGGTSLFGAVGSVHGPLIGAFILATINNGANLLNVNSFWQRIITGGLIILIVFFDQLRRRAR